MTKGGMEASYKLNSPLATEIMLEAVLLSEDPKPPLEGL